VRSVGFQMAPRPSTGAFSGDGLAPIPDSRLGSGTATKVSQDVVIRSSEGRKVRRELIGEGINV
jgi:hypothetical protein